MRALRLSSRPPKAGAPLPAELATKLTEGAGAALTDDAAAERWVAVLDALAFAPVRDKVIPTSLPKDLHADVKATIARLATRIPKIAHIFEIAPDRNAPRPKFERRRPKKPAQKPKPDEAEGPRRAQGREAPKAEPKADEPTDAATTGSPTPSRRSAHEAPTTSRRRRAEGDGGPVRWSRACRPWRTCRRRSRSCQPIAEPGEAAARRRGSPAERRRRATSSREAAAAPPSSNERPRYSPVAGSSSQRAPQDEQAHESRRNDAR